MVWLGAPSAGVRLKLKGDGAAWDSPRFVVTSKRLIPRAWAGDDSSGGCDVTRGEGQTKRTEVRCFSGGQLLKRGAAPRRLRFDLLLTPSREPDLQRHWARRGVQHGYQKSYTPSDALALGASFVNIHQGTRANPWINYPLDSVASLQTWTHATRAKNCLLYTSPSPRDGLLSRMPSSA